MALVSSKLTKKRTQMSKQAVNQMISSRTKANSLQCDSSHTVTWPPASSVFFNSMLDPLPVLLSHTHRHTHTYTNTLSLSLSLTHTHTYTCAHTHRQSLLLPSS